MLSKSDRRLEAKKRKAEAFLNLVKEEAEASCSQDSKDGKEEKKARTDKAGISPSAEEMIAAYKKELKERQKTSMQKPKLFLTLDELTRDHPVDSGTDEIKQLPPLFITDVQHLLLYALQGLYASIKPRWCRLLRVGKVDKVVTVVLDSLSTEDFKQYGDSLPTLKGAFDISVEMVAPVQYSSSVREDLLNVPLSITQMSKMHLNKKVVKKLNKETAIANSSTDNASQDDHSPEVSTTHEQDVFDRTCLLLNPQQMMYEGYPLPLSNENMNSPNSDFVYSKESYKQVSRSSPVFAIDCEMVQTTVRRNELARVSVVNENLECIYDTLVKPDLKIIDYVTKYSGITKLLLDPVTTRLEDVQRQLSEILPEDGILCGQSLNGDLNSLKMYHPYVIDTSVIYNLTGNRRMKTGLKRLTEHFLRRNIQSNPLGHNSVEDAIATMELVLLKLRNGLFFGDLIMSGPEALVVGNQDNVPKTNECENNIAQENQKNTQTNTTTENETNSDCDSIGDVTNNEGDSIGDTTTHSDCDEKCPKEEKNRTSVGLRNLSKKEMKKRKVFFQRKGNRYVQSFFDVIKKQKKTGKITDCEDCTSLYSDKQLLQMGDSDKDRQLLANSSVLDTDFNLVHLYGFREFLQENSEDKESDNEAKKKCLWKLDRRVWKILKSVPTRSIFVVILTGRLDDQSIKSAMTFAKVT